MLLHIISIGSIDIFFIEVEFIIELLPLLFIIILQRLFIPQLFIIYSINSIGFIIMEFFFSHIFLHIFITCFSSTCSIMQHIFISIILSADYSHFSLGEEVEPLKQVSIKHFIMCSLFFMKEHIIEKQDE